jgi:hypothetical protein
MSSEGVPNSESIDRQILIEALKSNGIEDPETRELLQKWLAQKETEAMETGSRKSQIEFEIQQAEIWIESGYADYAADLLEETLRYLRSERDPLNATESGIPESMLRKEMSLEEIDSYISAILDRLSSI